MKLGYVIIYVTDVSAALEFYHVAFGFEIRLKYEEEGQVDYGELATGEATLGFASHELGQANVNGQYQQASINTLPFGQELAFVTDDVSAAYQRAIAAGAVNISPPIEKPWGQTVAYVRAAEGTLIELCSPMG